MDTYAAGSVIYHNFNTHTLDGTPITLAGSPALGVYKDNSTTEDDSGITLTVDFDSRTGLHNVIIDTSQDPTFYASDHDYSVVITAGTVDSVSVVGTEVFRFRLGTVPSNLVAVLGTALTETVSGYLSAGLKTLLNVATPVFTVASINQTGDSYAKVDTEVAAIKAKTDLIPASPAQEGTLSTVNGKVDSILEDTNMLQTDWVNSGRLDLLIDGIKAKTDLVPASPAAVGSKMDIVDAPSATGKAALAAANADQVWDEVASGHVAAESTGALLALMHSILGGKQQIVSNQLICYAADNTTEVARFNLFDSAGNPTMVNVYLRNRV